MRRLMSVFLLAILLAAPVSGCSNAVKTSNAAGLDDSISALAGGGVAVMDDVTSETPLVGLSGTPSAMRFTQWQVRNLVAQANAHNGYLGGELDRLFPPPAGVPPLSAIVGAWLTRNQGPLAAYALRFMEKQDYKEARTVVFPTIVVLTFIADIARVSPSAQRPAPPFDLGPWIASPAQADGLCPDVANWVGTVVNNVTSAVQSNGSGWLASIWNLVVSIAGQAFTIVANGVLQSVVGFVTEVATVVATITQVASMFTPWSVQLAGDPTSLTLGTAPVDGSFDAVLQAQDIPWPATLVKCVSSLSGVNVTDASYKNAKVDWTDAVGIPGLATSTSHDATLRTDKTAHYLYATETRPTVDDCPRVVPAGPLGMTVNVERADVSKVIDSLVQLITNKLPPQLQSFLQSYEQGAIDAGKEAIGNFKGPHAHATIQVMEVVADPLCSHTPPPGGELTPEPPSQQRSQLPLMPCDALLNRVNIGAAYPGSVQLNPYMRPETRRFYSNVMLALLSMGRAASVSSGGLENNPRIAGQSGCAIGPPYTPPADLNVPDDPPVQALFLTQPPDGRPVIPANTDPACVAALGPELAAFDAGCQINHTRAGLLLFVFSKTAEYDVETFGGGGDAMTLMRLVLQSLVRDPAPSPSPTE